MHPSGGHPFAGTVRNTRRILINCQERSRLIADGPWNDLSGDLVAVARSARGVRPGGRVRLGRTNGPVAAVRARRCIRRATGSRQRQWVGVD
jgi:diadenosine tetraphosphatase ApaH/serine/threonine PP2A family protein phosphatase